MKIEELFFYDLKYGRLKSAVSDGIFYSTGKMYMDEEVDEILSRLKHSELTSYSGKRYMGKCKYCGNDTFYIVPYTEDDKLALHMDSSESTVIKNKNVCSECGKPADQIDKWEEFPGIKIDNKNFPVVEMLNTLYTQVKDTGLRFDIPSVLRTPYHSHIFGMKITNDFDYMVDMYVNGDKNHIIEMLTPMKREYPSIRFIVFNLGEHIKEVHDSTGIEFYSATDMHDMEIKFKEFLNSVLTLKFFKFGICQFDDVLLNGLELNNIYGLEIFSSGNSTFFLLKFLKHGLENNQNGLYITNRNAPEYILNISDSINLDMKKYVNTKNLIVMNSNSSLTKIDTGMDQWKIKEEISKFISEISKYVTKYNIKRLVIDSIEPLEVNGSEESIRYLFNELRNLDCVIVCTKFINNINANPIEDLYFTGIAEIGQIITENQIKNLLILKKFNLTADARRIVEFEITVDGELEIADRK